MSGEILDLDAVARPDKRVVFEGTEYRLPGDPPSGLVVRMHALQKALGETRQAVADALASDDSNGVDGEGVTRLSDELRECVHELFALRNPSLADDFLNDFSYPQIAQVFYFAIDLYQPPDPTPPKPAAKTRSRKSSPRSASSRKPAPRRS